jgi:hypothetical protein
MKRALLWLGIVLGGLLVLACGVGLLLPTRVSVSRSHLMQAPLAAVYPLVANFKHGWSQWNTFDDEDPGIRYTYSGPDNGVGATATWISEEMGDGHMRITAADPSRIVYELSLPPRNFGPSGSPAPSSSPPKATAPASPGPMRWRWATTPSSAGWDR